MTVLAQGEQGRSADNRGDRPLLRGWLHAGAFFAWLIGGPFLIAAGPDAAATAELAVYVAGMLVMFGTSAAFQRLRWSAPAWRRMRRADHAQRDLSWGLRGRARRSLRPVVAGVGRGIAHPHARVGRVRRPACRAAPGVPRRAAMGGRHPLRHLVGWLPHQRGAAALVRSLGVRGRLRRHARGWVVLHGGGAWSTRSAKPDPWPRVFGFHEVFHACTVIGAGLFAGTSSRSLRCRAPLKTVRAHFDAAELLTT